MLVTNHEPLCALRTLALHNALLRTLDVHNAIHALAAHMHIVGAVKWASTITDRFNNLFHDYVEARS